MSTLPLAVLLAEAVERRIERLRRRLAAVAAKPVPRRTAESGRRAAVVYGGAGTERQGGTFSGVLLLIFAFLCGSFIQMDSLPDGVRRFSPLSPFYWGTTGYRELIRDGGLFDVLPQVGVLAGLGVVLLSAGTVLLRRRIGRGAA